MWRRLSHGNAGKVIIGPFTDVRDEEALVDTVAKPILTVIDDVTKLLCTVDIRW